VLKEVLGWTGGQPFLTQKLCQFVSTCESSISVGYEAENVEQLVRSRIIENWESQDNPEHLRTIRDRILRNEQRAGRLLGLYQPILQQGEIAADDSLEQMELRLSGLVVKKQGKLRIYNRIYETVFNQIWVDKALEDLRIYSEAITAWLASRYQDESRLLRGQTLKEALAWAANKSLSDQDYQFLTASQDLANLEAQMALTTEKQATQILSEAQQKAKRTISMGSAILIISLMVATTAGILAGRAFQNLREAQEGTRLEREGVSVLQEFKSDGREIEALLSAMRAGQDLKNLVKDGRPLHDYPTISPLFALQQILDNIRQRNQMNLAIRVDSVSFSPDQQHLATIESDGVAKLWDLSGRQIAQLNSVQGEVYCVSFSPDGKRIATAGRNGKIQIWDLSGKQLALLKGHQDYVNSLNFSPDGQLLATAGGGGAVRLWSLSGQVIAQWKGNQDGINSLSFSPDGRRIVTAGEDGTVQLWNLLGEQIAQWKSHPSAVTSVSYSPDGQQIATAGWDDYSSDSIVRLWSQSGQQLAQIDSSKLSQIETPKPGQVIIGRICGGSVFSKRRHCDSSLVNFSPDGQKLVWTGIGGVVLLKVSGEQIAQLKGHQSQVIGVIFSPNGQQLTTVDADGKLQVWNLSRQQTIQLESKSYFSGVGITFSVDREQKAVMVLKVLKNSPAQRAGIKAGDRILAIDANSTIDMDQDDVRNLLRGEVGTQVTLRLTRQGSSDFKLPIIRSRVESSSRLTSANFSPDGQRIATTKYDSRTVQTWTISGQQLAQWTLDLDDVDKISRRLFDSFNNFFMLSFSPDGQRIATTQKDKVQLWNLSGQLVAEFKSRGHRDVVINRITLDSISFSQDGQHLATLGDDLVRLWDLSGRQMAELKGNNVTFSSDGQRIATEGRDNIARIWNLSGRQMAELKGNNVTFSPDGQRIATEGRDNTARIWNLSGRQMAEFKGNNVTFSPDGKRLATATNDGTVHIWDLSGKQLAELKGFQRSIQIMKFSPDGQRLVTAGEDDTIFIWDASGKQLAELKGNQSSARSISFSPDGQRVAIREELGQTILIWDLLGRQIAEYRDVMDFSPNWKYVATLEDGKVQLRPVRELDELLVQGCDWLKDYFVTHPEALKKQEVCQKR
jgi:WD40 repeat protein